MPEKSDIGKVIETSLSFAMAPAILETEYRALVRIENLLDSLEDGLDDGTDLWKERQFSRFGFLLLAMAHIEETLRSGCEELSLPWAISLRLKHIRGHSAFERCRLYLQRVIRANEPSVEMWQELDSYRHARNAVAHQGKLTIVNDEKKREAVERLPGIDIERPGIMIINHDFCKRLYHFALEFITELQTVAVRLHQRASRGSTG